MRSLPGVAGDLLLLLLVLSLLARRGLPPRRALLHGANPYALFAATMAGGTHLLVALPTLAALDLRERGRRGAAWTLCFAAVTGAAFLLGTRGDEGRAGGDTMHALVRQWSGSATLAGGASALGLAACALLVVAFRRDPSRAALFAIGGLVLLAPGARVEDVAMAFPLVCLWPSLSWIALGFMAVLGWGSHPALAWVPFLVLALWEGRRLPRRLLRGGLFRPLSWPAPVSYSVVIPALDEAGFLPGVLGAVGALLPPPAEVLVGDGGSTDGTSEIASRSGARVVPSPRGRGRQVRVAAAEARGDVILVLHADARPLPDVASRMLAALRWNPSAAGGAVGQRFTDPGATLRLVEILNDGRALLGGWSFGDQGQFFRRAALGSVGGVPDIPLMEDVELSLRLGEAGGSVYLGGGLQVLARSWKTAFFRRVWLVIRLVLRYRWRRLRGEIRSDDLYAAYYPGKGRVHEPGCTGKGKCARE